MSFISKAIVPAGLMASSLFAPSFAEGIYAKAGAGVTQFSDVTATVGSYSGELEFDSGMSYGVGLGYDFGNDFRAELGFNQANGELEKIAGVAATADLEVSTLSVSIFKDFSNDSNFTPYVGVGVGTTNIDIDTITLNSTAYAGADDDATSLSLTLGSSIEMGDTATLFVEGTYTNVDDLDITGVKYTDISSLGANVGVKFAF